MFGKTGSILLSIGNLPPQVSRKDLKAHVQRVVDKVNQSWLRLSPSICSCTILRLTHPATGAVSHQGIVSIHPPKLALAVVSELESAPLRGVQLKVSRYRHGSFSVNTDLPLMTMSDLLGVQQDQATGEVEQLKLDLVGDTGLRQPAARANVKDSRGGRAFAH